MDISFLAVGRLKGPEQELCDRYLSRIENMGRQLGIGKCAAFVINEGRGNNSQSRQKQEAEALLKKITDKAFIVALDERGRTFDSSKFSKMILDHRDEAKSELVFILGGPDGHAAAVLQRADLKLSLSAMTMPHGLARVVLAEQVYRAMTIIGNHPYHRA